jgi:hypothetical protein
MEIRLDRHPGVSLGVSITRLVLRVVDVSPDRHLVRDDAGEFVWSCTAEEWRIARLLVEAPSKPTWTPVPDLGDGRRRSRKVQPAASPELAEARRHPGGGVCES